MKFFFIFLFFLLNPSTGPTQVITDISGEWKVTAVEVIGEKRFSAAQHQTLNEMKGSLQKAWFIFRKDYSMEFRIKDADLAIKKGRWSYDRQKEMISVFEWESPFSLLMEIYVETYPDGSTHFLVNESPFNLTVERY